MGKRLHRGGSPFNGGLKMCFPAAKSPYTPQMPIAANQGQVNDQLQRQSTSNLGVASTMLTSPMGVTVASPTATKALIGS